MKLLQISAGRGPAEVRQFVALLAPHLVAKLQDFGQIHHSKDQEASQLFVLDEDAARAATAWTGIHALLAPLRGRGQRRRWFVQVSLHDPPDTQHLKPDAIVWSAARSGGPGGQNVNKRATAVRAVDRATGLSVRATGQRSQGQNRRDALARLTTQVETRNERAAGQAAAQRRAVHDQLRRGDSDFVWTLDPSGTLREG